MEKQIEDILLAMLARVESQVDKVRSEDIPAIRERLKGVEIKSAIGGAITGSIGGALVIVATLLMRLIH